VVAVYDTGSEDGTHFIVMEYVDGRTLKDVIRAEAPLYPDRAAEICADVCAALAAAHARGLVHRDVKPANIMLMPDGRVKLMDLGIARAAAGETLTQTAAMLGTAQYLSPEQAQGQDGRLPQRPVLPRLLPVRDAHRHGAVPWRRPRWPSPTGTSARTRPRRGCSTPTCRRRWRRCA
jgi:serine/threonine protein kinase